jgi:hypothetical protein
MGSKLKTRVIQCPVQKRPVEVTYRVIGNWFNREYDIQSCPAMHDRGSCDRPCKRLLTQSPIAREWYSRY